MMEYRRPQDLKPHATSLEIYGENHLDEQFVADIGSHGIRQPLLVTGDNTIISGHRRWRVALLLNLDSVPVELADAFAGEMEERRAILANNLQRKKTFEQEMREAEVWKVIEAADAEARMRSGVAQCPRVTSEAGCSKGETAEVVGRRVGIGGATTYRHAERVWHEAKQGNPVAQELVGQLNRGDVSIKKAYRILASKEREEAITAAALEPLPSNIILLEGDYFEQIVNVPDGSVDLLLADPPYSVMEDYAWDKKSEEFYHDWLRTVKPKLKEQFTGFIFCDARRQYEFETILREYFEVKNRLIWIRKNMSMGRVIKDKFISSYEVVFYFGSRDLNLPLEWGAERFDSCEFAVPQSNFSEGKFHPTQKPLGLISQLVRVGSFPGDTVLDCFAGSGTTGLACKYIQDRKCVLIEKEPEYNTIIKGLLNA